MKTELLRHTLATLAYRGGKVMRGAPAGFAEFKAFPTTRTPGQILAHIGDLLDWGLALADGHHSWHNSGVLDWESGTARFFTGLDALERRLASGAPLGFPEERIFQGPIADALTHVGQIAMLRRMAGSPVRGENYFRAEIVAGRVGPEQAAPNTEFE
ncbi:MAG TPA: hypothetical protein VG675_18180 [Bryobacteraceae bacterium]|nr:hypothetical protein [Bryobacteraceae bacterium]